MYSPDVYSLTHNIRPDGGHSFLPGRRFHGAHSPPPPDPFSPSSTAPASRPPLPNPVVRLYVAVGYLPPYGSAGTPLGSRRRSFRKPGQAGGIDPGRAGTRVLGGHGHEGMGAAPCVRQPFLAQGSRQGAELDTRLKQWNLEGVDILFLFLLFLSCHDEVRVQAPKGTQGVQRRACLWVEPLPSSHELHGEGQPPQLRVPLNRPVASWYSTDWVCGLAG